ncbi:MAG: hypothetical protein IPK82_32920 [Polyangiaceae bacterium]|nr:hypothetical protein [Polyangiaceae bacterium]
MAITFALCALAQPSFADDAAGAHDAYEAGAKAFGQSNYIAAAAHFAKADDLAPAAAALEMAIKSAILADDAQLAMRLAARAEGREPNVSVAAQVTRAKEKFGGKVGRLTIQCAAPCEAKVGAEPAQVGVARVYIAGNHAIEIAIAGTSRVYAVQLSAGADLTWSPPKEPETPPSSAATNTTFAAPSVVYTAPPTVTASAAPSAVDTASPGPVASRAISPAWFGIGVGVTAVAGALVVGFGLDTVSRHNAFVLDPTAERAAGGRDAELRTNVMIGVTAAAAITTALLGYFTFRAAPSASSSAAKPAAAAFQLR